MANAVVGDDVLNDDPTVQELERKCAKLFGKEAALFVPSGVMGNLIAIMVHCRERGSEVMLGYSTHTYLYEQGTSYFNQMVSQINSSLTSSNHI